MSSEQLTCAYCDNTFPNSRTSCPHCARPQLFPNVSNATSTSERAKLDARFAEAKSRCDADNRSDEFERFREATSNSQALFTCTLEKLHRELATGTEVFETYYQLEELRLRETAPIRLLDWEKLRPQAEIELLGSHNNIERLHYACLSLDWNSLTSYGDCVVKLNTDMIAHRASCFEGNTAIVFFKEHNFSRRLRSSWDDRDKLVTAVFAGRLPKGIASTEFPTILVATGETSADDEFIEVHVFGTMTAKTFSEVKFLTSGSGRRESVYREAIIEKLNKASVSHLV